MNAETGFEHAWSQLCKFVETCEQRITPPRRGGTERASVLGKLGAGGRRGHRAFRAETGREREYWRGWGLQGTSWERSLHVWWRGRRVRQERASPARWGTSRLPRDSLHLLFLVLI